MTGFEIFALSLCGSVVGYGIVAASHWLVAAVLRWNRTDVVVNALSPIGFVVVSVRPIRRYADDAGVTTDITRVVDVAIENMKHGLTPCATCHQINGIHRADCVEVAALTDMGCDAMLSVEGAGEIATGTQLYGDECADCGRGIDTMCATDCPANKGEA